MLNVSMYISTGDNMTQLDLFEDVDQKVKDFVDANSFDLTDEVIDFINERLTEIFNTDYDTIPVDDFDTQVAMADAIMKQVGKNLQSNPEEWI